MIFNPHVIRQFILTLCGVFICILIVEWGIINTGNAEQASLSSFSDQSQKTEQLLSKLPALQAGEYSILSAAPLFVEGRGPIESDVNDAAQGVGKKPDNATLQIRLMGLTLSAADSLALVVDPKGQYYRLFVGDEVLGWKLTSVEQNSATFDRGGKAITLTLEKHQIGKVNKSYRSRQLGIGKALPVPTLKK